MSPKNGARFKVAPPEVTELPSFQTQASHCIQQFPLVSVAAMFGLGFIIGSACVAIRCAGSRSTPTVRSLAERWADSIVNSIPSQITHAFDR